MSWAQIREMDEHGIEFGAHTLTHPRLDQLHPDEIEDEVVGCKSAIEDRLGHGVQFFAYPYGRHSRIDEDLVSRTYVGACGGGLGYVGPKSDPFALERVDSYYIAHPWMFKGLSSPWLSLYLSVRRPLRTVASVLLRRAWS